MRKAIITTAIALCSFTGRAQESTGKLKMHAVNLGFGVFNAHKNATDASGLTFLADATFALDKNLFSVSYLGGQEEAILADTKYNFNELSLLYGREWRAAKWFSLEGFAGVGYYNQKIEDEATDETEKKNTVSIPLRVNPKFYITKKFGLGFCINYSINSRANNLSENLIFHYRFN
ncbi:outer membrane beta-barrel protein [Flavobacterium sp. AS60]|uniref:DUF2715 domain-containing protein n=1 Tax=Flavobacterium anseongense TaxID=2910677 RepID=UPI001F2D73A9|nr:DUF2715 domain-containing protein [Flavobacterium sp. AS60]MCF6129597.1 outer membrane beta-barrel protein [Flavobacterium sp. AS60]